MLSPRQSVTEELRTRFAAIRSDLGVVEEFPAEVLELATERAARSIDEFTDHDDQRSLELSSIDPEGSRDLDQAFDLERTGDGYRLHYAIADVGAWVEPGDAIDLEARRRGMTIYSPDRRIALHPPVLSEGAASLLEEVDRPAIVWAIDLDRSGEIVDVAVRRSIVRNRRQLTYTGVQHELDRGTDDEQLLLLAELGAVLIDAESRRGGVSLELPEQSVSVVDGHFEIRYDAALAVERFNAQLSLATGRAAAALMVDAGVGILRTLPPADPSVFDSLRLSAASLGIGWPVDLPYADWVRTLDASSPEGAALMNLAARTLRGSGYLAFDGDLAAEHEHAAIAAPYAHVTAPLRRLVDRFGNECVLAAAAGRRPDQWVLDALAELPAMMSRTGQLATAVDRAAIDVVEAAALLHRVGDEFDAMAVAHRKGATTIQLHDPAVISTVEGELPIGRAVRVRLDAASLDGPAVHFSTI